MTDYFRANNMELELVQFEKADEVVQAYDKGRCDVYTTDASGLYSQRLKLANADDHIVSAGNHFQRTSGPGCSPRR